MFIFCEDASPTSSQTTSRGKQKQFMDNGNSLLFRHIKIGLRINSTDGRMESSSLPHIPCLQLPPQQQQTSTPHFQDNMKTAPSRMKKKAKPSSLHQKRSKISIPPSSNAQTGRLTSALCASTWTGSKQLSNKIREITPKQSGRTKIAQLILSVSKSTNLATAASFL